MTRREIQPGEEYILWFVRPQNRPAEMNVAITLSPVGTNPPRVSPLSIARALADAMGGQTWAESPGPGLGATFVVELPA